jgi:hypothetical protein
LRDWKKWVGQKPGMLYEGAFLPLRRTLQNMVVSRIDKYPVDGVIVCARKWMQAVMSLGSGMKPLPCEEVGRIYDKLFLFADKHLTHCPYVGLAKAVFHEFGTLKAWLKFKSVKGGWPEQWSMLKWRPVSSYAAHHWKELIAIAGRFCTAAVKTLDWGFAADCPRNVLEEVHSYNYGRRQGDTRLQRDLYGEVEDIENFFPSIDQQELHIAAKAAIPELRTKDPTTRFF